jgi:acyl carrier protein
MNNQIQEKNFTEHDIEAWLVSYIARELNVSLNDIDVTVPLERYGLSSMHAVLMAGDLEEWLGRQIDPTLPYDYPTIETLAQRLSAYGDR